MLGVIAQEIEGEIIVTNLMSKSFPIIRYKLGDYISIGDSINCPCGSEAPIIKDILGRVGKNILGKLNKYPSLTFYYIFKNLAVKNGLALNYQVIQKKKGALDFLLEGSLNEREEIQLKTEINKYFKNDVETNILYNQKFHTYSGKKVDFISRV